MEEQTRIKRTTRDAQFLLKTIKRRLDDYDFTEDALEDLVSRLVGVVDYLEDLPEPVEEGVDETFHPTRYMLHPGWVVSKSDGDRHYNHASFVHLYPRDDGDYRGGSILGNSCGDCSTVEGPCPRHKETA